MASPSGNPSSKSNPPPISGPEPKPRKTFWDSFEEQPFKAGIVVNTLALIYSYIAVALISMWITPYDFGIPLKWVFTLATISTFLTLLDKFYLAAKNKSMASIWESIERIAFQTAFLIARAFLRQIGSCCESDAS